MSQDERIHAHVVSVWREGKKFFTIGGKEGMLVLTDSRLAFIHKTNAKMKWWQAVVPRQALTFMKSKNTMIRHDGYDEKIFQEDLQNKKNVAVTFNNITKITIKEEVWGSVLYLEYMQDGSIEKYQFSVAQDWVKYPMKDPTKFMKVDWKPFVDFIAERRVLVE